MLKIYNIENKGNFNIGTVISVNSLDLDWEIIRLFDHILFKTGHLAKKSNTLKLEVKNVGKIKASWIIKVLRKEKDKKGIDEMFPT